SFCGRGVEASPGQEQPAGWFVTGVYVGLPSEAVDMVSNQTKTVRKSK
uniref:Uncharacterized protein n=1 Tax=Neovison vison TaxID=452646 RepID=A0A8C7AUD5_NEOVI